MTQALKRGLFGYRTAGVKSVLADREQMFSQATREVALAHSRGEALSAELEAAHAERASVGAELEAVRGELEVAQTARDALEADLETIRAERDAANAERATLISELVSARTERDTVRNQIGERDRLLEEATARATSLAADVESARTDERTQSELARKASAELAGLRRDLAEANGKARMLERTLEDRDADLATASLTGAVTPAVTNSSDLDRVLLETQTTIDRIVTEARRGAEVELAEVERRRDAVLAEVDALEARRDRLAPLAENVRELLGVAKARTEEADARLRSVLEPLSTAVGELKGGLIQLIDEAEREDPDVELVAEGEEPAGSPDGEPSAVIHLADRPNIARSPW